MGGQWLLAGAWCDGWRHPTWPYWWCAPTHLQAKGGFLRYIVEPARSAGILRTHTESAPIRAELINGAMLEARSWDNPDGLYGPTVARILVDEFGFLTAAGWLAMRSRTTETAMHGFGDIRMVGNVGEIGGKAEELFVLASSGAKGYACRTWTWRDRAMAASCVCDLGIELSEAELHAETCERGSYLRDLVTIRDSMSEMQFRQLYGAEWVDWSALPVYNFDRSLHVTKEAEYREGTPIDLSCDFNVGPMQWALGQHHGDEAWTFDEIVLPGGATTEAAAREFMRRFPNRRLAVNVYGDASGRSTSTKSHQSDYDIIRNLLTPHYSTVQFNVPAANPPVSSRINAVNAVLLSASGRVRYTIHPRCETGAKSLARTSYKQGTRDVSKPSGETITHWADAEGYRLTWLFPIAAANRPALVGVRTEDHSHSMLSEAY